MPGMSAGPAAADGAIAAGGEIAIEAFELGFKPAVVAVAAAGSYPVTFHNTGAALHDLTFADGTKLTADPGATVKGTVNVPAAGLTFLCSIPGHSAAGSSISFTLPRSATSPSPTSRCVRSTSWSSGPPRR